MVVLHSNSGGNFLLFMSFPRMDEYPVQGEGMCSPQDICQTHLSLDTIQRVRMAERDMETRDRLRFQPWGLWTQRSMKNLENEELVPFWSR